MRSATEFSLAYLRALGFDCDMLEHLISRPRGDGEDLFPIRRDVFGFDILAVRDDEIRFVQTTSISNAGKRRKKLLAHPGATSLALNARCEVHGWNTRRTGSRRAHRPNVDVMTVTSTGIEFVREEDL